MVEDPPDPGRRVARHAREMRGAAPRTAAATRGTTTPTSGAGSTARRSERPQSRERHSNTGNPRRATGDGRGNGHRHRIGTATQTTSGNEAATRMAASGVRFGGGCTGGWGHGTAMRTAGLKGAARRCEQLRGAQLGYANGWTDGNGAAMRTAVRRCGAASGTTELRSAVRRGGTDGRGVWRGVRERPGSGVQCGPAAPTAEVEGRGGAARAGTGRDPLRGMARPG
ncbi:hypothetical protein J3R03_000721 [Actinoplanes couchii]|nr:hypothetical protein [Actinoplanes couchii]